MIHRFKVNKAFLAASEIPRNTLLVENVNKNKSRNSKYFLSFSNVPVFSTSYSSEFIKIKNPVPKYLPILLNDPIYSEVLSKGIKSVSQGAPTLGGSLSPSLFSNEQSGSNWLHCKDNFKCGTTRCNYCSYIKKGKCVKSCTNGKTFDFSSFINCNTQFLVYLITSEVCHIQNVGHTICRLKDRLYDHLYDIEKNRSTNVVKH